MTSLEQLLGDYAFISRLVAELNDGLPTDLTLSADRVRWALREALAAHVRRSSTPD
jgi:hypothetical protein